VFTDHVSQYPQFAAQGQLLDLTELIERDGVDLSIYQDGLADLGSIRRALATGCRRTGTHRRASTTPP
jgi:hypothetical protein